MPNGTFYNSHIQATGRTTRSYSTSTLDPTYQLETKIKSLQITTISQMPVELVSCALQIYDTKSKYYNRNRLHVKTIKRQNAMDLSTASIPPYNSDFDGDEGIVPTILSSLLSNANAPLPESPVVVDSDSDSDIDLNIFN